MLVEKNQPPLDQRIFMLGSLAHLGSWELPGLVCE